MPQSLASPIPIFAELLSDLFERRRRRYTLRDIATAISGETEPHTVKHQYLSRQFNDIDQNPTIRDDLILLYSSLVSRACCAHPALVDPRINLW